MVGQEDQIDMRISYEWENLYLVDIAMSPHKVGVIVKYKRSLNHFGFDDLRYIVKKRLLEEGGWDLVEVNYDEFTKNSKVVIKQMIQELKKVKKGIM